MERQKGRSLVYRREISVENNPQTAPRVPPGQKRREAHFSISKSSVQTKNREIIKNIKQKCLKRQLIDGNEADFGNANKNYSLADEELDSSLILSEQTDDVEIQYQQWSGSLLFTSKFPGRPSAIFFKYPTCCQIQNSLIQLKQNKRLQKVGKIFLKYRIYGSEYKCIVNAFEFNGFHRCSNSKDWNVFFDVRGSKVKKTYQTMEKEQKFNHFAGCWALGRKDQLWRGIQKLRKIFPEDYSYVPKTYIFPYDYDRFELAREQAERNQIWIKKPVASACGRNIKLISTQTRVHKKPGVLISEYISNPHLINNFKYDLRLNVMQTSFNPLKIYLYEDGLARFATEEYTSKKINRKFVHLTNFSINKHSKNFIENKNEKNPSAHASKWSLRQLKEHYKQLGIQPSHIFHQIQDIVVKTCISAEESMMFHKYRHENGNEGGFEIYGFDILIDSKLKAWLLEVNVCPSLCSSSSFDRKIKHTLLVDTLNLIGVSVPETGSAISLDQKNDAKRRFKNPHSISKLSYQNCVEILFPEDWLIIFQYEQERDRMALGNYKLLFPSKQAIFNYQKFFTCNRYNNLVLWKYILSSRSFLNRLSL